jgi:2-dehydropantoate 2-reductase
VRLEPLPGTSLRLVAYLLAMLAGVVAARAAARLETYWPLKGSTWQSVERGRRTEVEFLNGEIVRIGKELGVPTPLNQRVVLLVHRAATERRFLTVHEVEQAYARTASSRRRGVASASRSRSVRDETAP